MPKIIYTIGHSTRTLEQFLDLLKAHKIKEVFDVRTIPMSGFNPQFNQGRLKRALNKDGLDYLHLKKLGGLRHSKKGSINIGWHNSSFRGFADYMGTKDFSTGLGRLEKIANKKRTVIMCAEAVPWRCHRSLIADALIKRKWKVKDIIQSKKIAINHELTPFLKMRKGEIIYPEIK